MDDAEIKLMLNIHNQCLISSLEMGSTTIRDECSGVGLERVGENPLNRSDKASYYIG